MSKVSGSISAPPISVSSPSMSCSSTPTITSPLSGSAVVAVSASFIETSAFAPPSRSSASPSSTTSTSSMNQYQDRQYYHLARFQWRHRPAGRFRHHRRYHLPRYRRREGGSPRHRGCSHHLLDRRWYRRHLRRQWSHHRLRDPRADHPMVLSWASSASFSRI